MSLGAPKFNSEAELAAAVASWGEALGWDVYKEVSIPDGDCDLVFVQGRRIWIIECKLRLSDELLLQALNRLSYGHHVSVAVPSLKGDIGVSKEFFLQEHGLGLLTVDHPDTARWKVRRRALDGGRFESTWTQAPDAPPNWEMVVHEEINPSARRRSDTQFDTSARYGGRAPKPNRVVMAKRIGALRAFLSPEHKKLIAGGRGGQLTPWRMAKLRVVKILTDHAPLTSAEILERLGRDHPWGSRRSALAGIGRMLGEICRREFVFADGKWSLASLPPPVV